MKKLSVLALSMVLTAVVFTGCRNNNKPMETTRPSAAPTTQATTAPTTQATQPSTAATKPTETMGTDNGMVNPTNGADGTVGEDTTAATGSAPESRGRMPIPRNR